MTPSMPIATDNIYKFAALFGVAILISVILAVSYLQEKNGELAFNNLLELEVLKSKDTLSKEETVKRNLLEEKDKALTRHMKLIVRIFSISLWIGIFFLLWGGINWWRKVQPKQDELLNLQIEKTKREIQVLDKQLENPSTENKE
jgi:hypothetical protein